jgi:hypothetical protein
VAEQYDILGDQVHVYPNLTRGFTPTNRSPRSPFCLNISRKTL